VPGVDRTPIEIPERNSGSTIGLCSFADPMRMIPDCIHRRSSRPLPAAAGAKSGA
jgi:hypothetical protein